MANRFRTIALAGGYGLLLATAAVAVLLVATRRPSGQPAQLLPAPTAVALRVHVSGAVANPGVYSLPARSIVQDALTAAGGALPVADTSRLNLARLLEDGDQVLVPETLSSDALQSGMGPAPAAITAGQGGIININTASAQELETLPRIGPALAQRIVDYRLTNGPFGAVEEIMDVTGIGQATFDQIKDLIGAY